MSVGPVGMMGSSDAERARQDVDRQVRAAQSQEKAESAAGVGETEQDQEASDRDADGRRLWEDPAAASRKADGEQASAEETQSKDPTGNRGLNLDLSG